MPRNLAPIALFVYNRPIHTAKTIVALQQNDLAKDTELFIFCDGPKNEQTAEEIHEVYKIVENISGFKNVTIKKSSVNQGLANSIISGVSEIVAKFGKIIVVEDDLVVAPHFLEFMNQGLEFYKDDERVISIHGYIYPVKKDLPETFFLRGADCWGWATWQRGWSLFNPNGSESLAQLKVQKLEHEFDFDGAYQYTKMLEDQIAGKNNSWAIRWHAAAFLANKLTLYPGKTLVKNIGFDDSGTHCGPSDEYQQEVFPSSIKITTVPVQENKEARELIKYFFKPKRSFFEKIKHKIAKRKLKKMARLNAAKK